MKPWYRGMLDTPDPALRAEVAKALQERPDRRSHQGGEEAGRVVEFRWGQGHLCGVLRPSTGRQGLLVLDQQGRELRVQREKVVDISSERIASQPRGETVSRLREIDRRREAARAGLDMRALWEVVREEGERAWSLDDLTGLYFGEGRGGEDRAVLSRALEEGYWFVRQGASYAARSAEAVAQGDQRLARQQEAEERLRVWAAWLLGAMAGREMDPPTAAEEAIALLEQVALHGEQAEDSAAAARLMQAAHLHGPQAAFEVLVRLGHWRADENLELRRCQVPVAFAPELLAQAEQCGWRPEARRSRRWWGRHTYGFAPEGRACDRAFSLRRTLFGYTVGVHLASPALLEERDGQVEAAARERGGSLHLPDRLVAMLPEALISRCRLTAGERRPALTVELRFDRRLTLKESRVVIRRVRLRQILDPEKAEARRDRRWQWLCRLAAGQRQRRQEAGALLLPEEPVELRVREGRIELRPVPGTTSERLVGEELAILANAAVAAFCARHQIPAIYRTAPPPAQVLEKGESGERVWAHEQLRRITRAELQTVPDRHHLLGVEACVPVTQPLHRYTDLLMHRQLIGFACSGAPRYSQEEMARVLVDTAWARQTVGRIESQTRRYWALKYLEDKQGEALPALVLERRGAGYLVELDDCRLKGYAAAGRELRAAPGDSLQVRISQVSARQDLLRLEAVHAPAAGA